MRREATKLNATPAWANKDEIEGWYELAKHAGKLLGRKFHVDHIYPLKSKFVCGLHVEQNLRVITVTENSRKGNRFWQDMPGQRLADLVCNHG